jgi:hypothetical protein
MPVNTTSFSRPVGLRPLGWWEPTPSRRGSLRFQRSENAASPSLFP